MDLELSGRVAIITGGGRGIGKAIALELAREGASIALVARTRNDLVATAKELSSESGQAVVPIVADTGEDAPVRDMVRVVMERLGRIDILVNCAAEPAGQSAHPTTLMVTRERLDQHMNVKVMGYLRCAREVAPVMIERRWGRIINIAGLGARSTGDAVGSIRNAGVVALSKSLADELHTQGINVNAVHPGLTRTEKVETLINTFAREKGISPAEAERRMSDNLIGRLPTAGEVAHVVAFLASPKSVAITGEVVVVAGGVKRIITY